MAKAQLAAGMVIDGFTLAERVHRGGMADIWSVTRGDVDFPVVMKVPLLDFESDISLLVGFEVEQMIMAELAGEHVPRLVASGDFATQPHLVMERIDGPTLRQRSQDRALPVDEIIGIGVEMAAALADLHQQQVLHLDLKPQNILFRPAGTAVLIDFGLSRHRKLPDLLSEQFHRPTGTPEYMAPEQLMQVRSDARSDIYALGAMLYQLATGEPPFGTPSRITQVRRRVWRDPVPPCALRPELPPLVQEVILRCLEPMPDDRYASAEDLLFDLRHPDLVVLTDRAKRRRQDGFRTVLGRRLRTGRLLRTIVAHSTRPPPRAPLILVAVDLRPGLEELHLALRDASASVLANMPGARLACVNVMPGSLLAIDDHVDASGENVQLQRLAALRRWAEPLALPKGKVTFHLLDVRNVAAGVLDFARSNRADHLIIGAQGTGGSFAGRTGAQITSGAPCTVTVVRAPAATEIPAQTWAEQPSASAREKAS